jgi:hypothetical protein
VLVEVVVELTLLQTLLVLGRRVEAMVHSAVVMGAVLPPIAALAVAVLAQTPAAHHGLAEQAAQAL